MTTIKEIAKLANVSSATVSNVLNNKRGQVSAETRDKIYQIIRENNYKPNRIAKSLRESRSRTIGVIAEDLTVFNTPSIINGIHDFAEQKSYHILLNDLALEKKIGHRFSEIFRFKKMIDEAAHILLSFQVDGIIYVGLHPRDVSGVVGAVNKPIVYVGCFSNGQNDVSVVYDDKSATYKATKALIDRGHCHIAIIKGPSNSNPASERLSGYLEALKDHNLEARHELQKEGDWNTESGYRIGKELLELNNPPTAIVAMNDLMAVGGMNAVQDKGLLVPQDISIIGFDDREFSQYTNPRLTTLRLPLHDMGLMAAKSLLALVEKDKSVHKKIELPCDLITRNSAGEWRPAAEKARRERGTVCYDQNIPERRK